MSADNPRGRPPASDETFQARGYELLAHLVASADTASREPCYYGTFRLLDAASKLAEFMVEFGVSDSWLERFHADIDHHKMLLMTNREAYYDYLTEASRLVAMRLVEMDLSDTRSAERPEPR